MFENMFGTLAVIASLTITVIGLPAQIIRNFKHKEVESFSPLLVYSAALSYTFWTAYGWASGNLFIKISQTPGLFLGLILIYQYIFYKKKPAK